ncbi:hypothetical protein [Methylobacterium sp. E-045]|uniref:hypothetical protein n=1 Tax=Methylobacterium sp. E-045 TaxID=2836575 RepID=UPI001FBB02B5|nr:hypothetical protein [Methylobacterium sp. E-045]MCJ2130975.1 hypothetical protein [Methylobacterium sp. E-045]
MTTKAGAFAAHDLKLCPLVVALPDKVPAHRRVGPLILDGAALLARRGRTITGGGESSDRAPGREERA